MKCAEIITICFRLELEFWSEIDFMKGGMLYLEFLADNFFRLCIVYYDLLYACDIYIDL